jgi:hypothetical protein
MFIVAEQQARRGWRWGRPGELDPPSVLRHQDSVSGDGQAGQEASACCLYYFVARGTR